MRRDSVALAPSGNVERNAKTEHHQNGDGNLGEVEGFRIRLVADGMRYGVDNCLTNTLCEPLIEFYAMGGTSGGLRGQFVNRYMLSTLLDRDEYTGLLLDATNPLHHVSPNGIQQVLKWACVKVPMVRNHAGFWRMSFCS